MSTTAGAPLPLLDCDTSGSSGVEECARQPLLQGAAQRLETYRFGQIVVHARTACPPGLTAQGIGRQCDDGNAPSPDLLAPNGCGQRIAVHLGHVEVAQ